MTDTNQTSDLATLISDAVAAKMTPEFVEEQVTDRVDRLVRDAIDASLRTYSENGNLIKKTVEEALRVQKLDLPSYGDTVTKMLKSKIEELVSPLVAGKLAEDMENLLSLAPKTVKLSEIVADLVNAKRDEGEIGDVVTCIVEENQYGSIWIYLDEEEHYGNDKKYNARIRFLMRDDGTIFSGTIGGSELKTSRTFGSSTSLNVAARGLDQKILSYYACGTIIEIDEDEVSTYCDYD